MKRTRLIFDNGGGITLQLDGWAHVYDDDDAKQCAYDIREWLRTGSTSGWEGHDADALAVQPTGEQIQNGGYCVVRIDRATDTTASLAAEIAAKHYGYNTLELAAALFDEPASAAGAQP